MYNVFTSFQIHFNQINFRRYGSYQYPTGCYFMDFLIIKERKEYELSTIY